MKEPLDSKPFTIAVRAYAKKIVDKPPSKKKRKHSDIGFSDWTLVFDTETGTDISQRFRFGCYQLRKSGALEEKGIFYDPQSLSDEEQSVLQKYAEANHFKLMTIAEFAEEVFLLYAYKLSALCVGFNLPFDLSRIAKRNATARKLRDGFTFIISEDKRLPNVWVKHINSHAAFIRFSTPSTQNTPRSRRNKEIEIQPHLGYFVDVKTLACALLSDSWSLETLGEHLKTEHRKLKVKSHSGKLTTRYLNYATQDVQVTWECFEKLQNQYESYGLTKTAINNIYSEASLGKAYLRQMGIKTWRELQPNFPPELIGAMIVQLLRR